MARQPQSARRPDKGHLQTLTVSSKGQITISAEARRRLAIEKGTHLLEIVVGDCLIYVPEHAYVTQAIANIQANLREAKVTVAQLAADMEAHREAVLREFYPDLVLP